MENPDGKERQHGNKDPEGGGWYAAEAIAARNYPNYIKKRSGSNI
jgi:hypothetical protein